MVALVAGAEALVRGASRLALVLGMSPLAVGLTVVAFGTSAPELAVSTSAAWRGEPDLAFGNVVGSNIFNVLLILGVSALAAPLAVARKLVRVDVPVMIGVSLVAAALAADGRVGRVDGLLLVSGLIAYTVFTVRTTGREAATEAGPAPPWSARTVLVSVAGIAIGLALLILGSHWFVEGATAVARSLGVSELVIGLTIVAAGTSLPEVVTSLVATVRGEREIAVGNVVGSNLFNLLGVLGVSAAVSPDGVGVAPAAMRFDLPVMIAAAVACLPIFVSGHRIDRWEGGVFLGYYVAYVTYLILHATQHDALPLFSAAMTAFVLPLTGLTILVVALRGRSAR